MDETDRGTYKQPTWYHNTLPLSWWMKQTEGHTNSQCDTIIPCHYHVAGYNIGISTIKGMWLKGKWIWQGFKLNIRDFIHVHFICKIQMTILDIGTDRFLQFWISIMLQCLPSSFRSIWLMVWEEMPFKEFQDGPRGSHLGYRNKTILAILSLYVALIPPIKFWLNPTYSLGDVIWRISRWLPWWPSCISERNNFSNSESLCRSDASHQVSAQSDLWFERCLLRNFKVATLAAILDIGTERF